MKSGYWIWITCIVLIIAILFILALVFQQLGVLNLWQSSSSKNKQLKASKPDIIAPYPWEIKPTEVSPKENSAGRAAKSVQTTYTVKRGDSLWKIAEHCYGDGSKWKLIYDMNKEKIPDKNNLRVGTVLTIPKADSKVNKPERR